MDNMANGANREEYLRPDLYDLENPDFEPDGPFILDLAREIGGSILEMGCGTGRITIPLASAGFEVTGLDVVPEMLALARAKAGDLPIQWIHADACKFQLNRTFDLIFESGSVFMHMLSNADQLAYLVCVRKHLAPQGRFMLTLLFPHPDNLKTNLEEQEWYTYLDSQGRNVRVSGTEQYHDLTQVKLETAIRRISDPDGEETMLVAPLYLRYTFPQEMERLLTQAGFEVREHYGGPDRSPLTEKSRYMVYICSHRGDQQSNG